MRNKTLTSIALMIVIFTCNHWALALGCTFTLGYLWSHWYMQRITWTVNTEYSNEDKNNFNED